MSWFVALWLLYGFRLGRRTGSLSPWSVDQIEQLARIAPDLRAWLHQQPNRVTPSGHIVAWGHHVATGRQATADQLESEDVAHAAAAVEMLHTFALLHDDVMDRSTVRRGIPTAHVSLAELHVASGAMGDNHHFGGRGGNVGR